LMMITPCLIMPYTIELLFSVILLYKPLIFVQIFFGLISKIGSNIKWYVIGL